MIRQNKEIKNINRSQDVTPGQVFACSFPRICLSTSFLCHSSHRGTSNFPINSRSYYNLPNLKSVSSNRVIHPLLNKINKRIFIQEKQLESYPTPKTPRLIFPKKSSLTEVTLAGGDISKQGDHLSLVSPMAPKALVKQGISSKSPLRAGKNEDSLTLRKPSRNNLAIISVLCGTNNTLLTLSQSKGKVLKSGCISAGSMGFKNSRKSTLYASQAAAKSLVSKLREQKITGVYIRLFGMGRAKGAVVWVFKQSRIKIWAIRECTPSVHNGCRPPKARRI